jgi:serine/threonine-protein kinase
VSFSSGSGAPEIGSEVGGYRLESLLGQGGMGTVYLARGREGGLCAVKVLSRRLVADDPTFATRFKREVQYADALDHPNVLELYEAGETSDGTPFFAMQYVDGPDLGVVLQREGRLSLPQALSILGPIADALDRAHANGLVHRDVKPGNIIVAADPDGPHPYLTDFGLSKNPGTDSFALTRMGQLIGTLAYTAPEEILATEGRGAPVDVYSLGCVLYEALTGAPPFVRARDIDVLYAHVGDPRPRISEARPDLPAGIDDVIARAMAISAPERYPSCTAFIDAVRALAGGESLAPPVAEPAPEETAVAPAEPTAPEPVAFEPVAEQEATPPGVLRLAVRDGLGRGRSLLVDDELVLGRQETLDGALSPDHSISRRHARITRTDDGTFAIEDEHSRNGTFVNGERLVSPWILRTGDLLKIGGTVFEATAPEPRVEVAAPPVVEPGPVVPMAAPAAVAPPPERTAPSELTPLPVGAGVVAEAGTRLALRLELDPDAGVLVIAIEDGPTVRIVRGSDGWHPEPS